MFCCQLTGKFLPLLGLSFSICAVGYTKRAKACTGATCTEWSEGHQDCCRAPKSLHSWQRLCPCHTSGGECVRNSGQVSKDGLYKRGNASLSERWGQPSGASLRRPGGVQTARAAAGADSLLGNLLPHSRWAN